VKETFHPQSSKRRESTSSSKRRGIEGKTKILIGGGGTNGNGVKSDNIPSSAQIFGGQSKGEPRVRRKVHVTDAKNLRDLRYPRGSCGRELLVAIR